MCNSHAFEFRELPCAVCGSTSRKALGWRGGEAHHDRRGVRVQIVRCESCSHLYPHPMPFPRANLSSLYTDPEDYFSAHDVETKKRNAREMMRTLESKLGRRGSVLDVGCGRGELLWAAREAGWEFAGVDPSPAYLEWGRVHLGIEAQLGTLEELKFADEGFDVILMEGLIEHLYDPYSGLREVWRLLKPGGICYLDAPNEDSLYMKIGNLYMRALSRDWVVNLAPTFPPYHVQGFNPISLLRLVERVGFKVEEFNIFGTVVPLTGKASLRKNIEHQAARLVNWLGNRMGAGVYTDVWLRKPY
ncbi:MAG: hypothetical protein QOJ88_356 [Pyrinomonadaceae bacterium]|nr:hypothetical protein [Pyrinomonadaceae bacterium]